MTTAEPAFEVFVREVRPRLLRALAPARGLDGADDGAAEALSFAWEHWEEVRVMVNPAGYLYRVAMSRTRPRRNLVLPVPAVVEAVDVEPGLVPALLALSHAQRAAVWLIHGCGWSYADAAEATGTSVSAIGNQLSRGMARLRAALEVESHA